MKQFLGEAGQLATWIEKKNEDIEEPESINQTKALIRRQQALDADMEALESKLKDLNSQKEKLGNETLHPDYLTGQCMEREAYTR